MGKKAHTQLCKSFKQTFSRADTNAYLEGPADINLSADCFVIMASMSSPRCVLLLAAAALLLTSQSYGLELSRQGASCDGTACTYACMHHSSSSDLLIRAHLVTLLLPSWRTSCSLRPAQALGCPHSLLLTA